MSVEEDDVTVGQGEGGTGTVSGEREATRWGTTQGF